MRDVILDHGSKEVVKDMGIRIAKYHKDFLGDINAFLCQRRPEDGVSYTLALRR